MANAQSISLVQIGALSPSAMAGGVLTFSIPGVASNLEASGQFTQVSPNGDYVWWANLSNNRGYFGITSNSSGKVAYAQIDGQHYMMYLVSYRYNAVVKVNSPPIYSNQTCLPLLESPEHLTVSQDCEVDNDCPAVVSILVLVTPEAFDWLGGNYSPLEGVLFVTLGLHTVNFALINSGVYHKTVRFIVEPYNFNFSQTPVPNALDDLLQLQNDTVANNRRGANRADLMYLITDSRYFPLLGATADGDTRYFGFTSMEYLLLPYYTFAHEVGHALYLNHNRISNWGDINYGADDFCGFGWRLNNAEEAPAKKTIMAVIRPPDNEPGAITLLNYSNPNVTFEGIATGTPINFNARYASHTMCSVDDYFADDELRVEIDGPLFICDQTPSYTAIITLPGAGVKGVGPYSIIWRLNNTGIFSLSNPGIPLGTGNPITIPGPLPVPEFWLFVSVSSADGVVVNDIIRVDNPCGSPSTFIQGTSSILEKESFRSTHQGFELSPNPSKFNLNVKFQNHPEVDEVVYSIFNALGEAILNRSIFLGLQNEFEVDLSSPSLPNGAYSLFVRSGAFYGAQKFIIYR